MKKIHKEKDDWGQNVIYVEECDKFKYEDPEIPKNPISSIHNTREAEICDIINAVENYFYNSGK